MLSAQLCYEMVIPVLELAAVKEVKTKHRKKSKANNEILYVSPRLTKTIKNK